MLGTQQLELPGGGQHHTVRFMAKGRRKAGGSKSSFMLLMARDPFGACAAAEPISWE